MGNFWTASLLAGRRGPWNFLARRHAHMVWAVCRRVLGNHHDAEDAFQAAFLIFVRKAASISPRAKVGNWLYGVAYQAALDARRNRTKRQKREMNLAALPEPALAEQAGRNDLQAVLDEEFSRLPEKVPRCHRAVRSGGQNQKRRGSAAWSAGRDHGRQANPGQEDASQADPTPQALWRVFLWCVGHVAWPEFSFRRRIQITDQCNHQGCQAGCSGTKRGWRRFSRRRRPYRRSSASHVDQPMQEVRHAVVRAAGLYVSRCRHRTVGPKRHVSRDAAPSGRISAPACPLQPPRGKARTRETSRRKNRSPSFSPASMRRPWRPGRKPAPRSAGWAYDTAIWLLTLDRTVWPRQCRPSDFSNGKRSSLPGCPLLPYPLASTFLATKVTDAGLKELAGLKNLQMLYLAARR